MSEPVLRTELQRIIAEGYAAGKPGKQIAAEAGVTHEVVRNIACRHGIKRPAPKSTFKRIPYAGFDRSDRWQS